MVRVLGECLAYYGEGHEMNYKVNQAGIQAKRKIIVFIGCALIVVSGLAQMFRPLPSFVHLIAVITLAVAVICLIYSASFVVSNSRK